MLISPKARVHDAFDPSVADAYGGEGKTPVEYGSTASLRVMCGAFGRTELTIVGCAPPQAAVRCYDLFCVYFCFLKDGEACIVYI